MLNNCDDNIGAPNALTFYANFASRWIGTSYVRWIRWTRHTLENVAETTYSGSILYALTQYYWRLCLSIFFCLEYIWFEIYLVFDRLNWKLFQSIHERHFSILKINMSFFFNAAWFSFFILILNLSLSNQINIYIWK